MVQQTLNKSVIYAHGETRTLGTKISNSEALSFSLFTILINAYFRRGEKALFLGIEEPLFVLEFCNNFPDAKNGRNLAFQISVNKISHLRTNS